MSKRFSIGKLTIIFVFRHRFERKKDAWDRYTIWRDYRIGFFYKRNKRVGTKDFKNPKKWSQNLRNSYMIGLDGIIFKTWCDISFGVKHF